jgi:hypothetical protein
LSVVLHMTQIGGPRLGDVKDNDPTLIDPIAAA